MAVELLEDIMSNRDRITVDLQSDSTSILEKLPRGHKRVGIVRQGTGEPGVLAITESGDYVQLDEGGMRTLNQRKVTAAIAAVKRPVGKPRMGYELREVYSIRLEPALAEYLRAVGGDNLSAGITKIAEAHRAKAGST